MARQRFAPWWMRTCLSCQNAQTSLESVYLLHYWISLNSGLLLGLTCDFFAVAQQHVSHLCSSCCSSLIQLVWHIDITHCFYGKYGQADRLLRRAKRQADYGGQAYAPRESKEFFAANWVSCSRKHTLLCSDEHDNPLLKRMLYIIGFSIHCNCL